MGNSCILNTYNRLLGFYKSLACVYECRLPYVWNETPPCSSRSKKKLVWLEEFAFLISIVRNQEESKLWITFTFMHLADDFIQSDLQLHSGYTFSLVCVFPGNRTHNLLRNWRNALPLSHTGTFKHIRHLICAAEWSSIWIYDSIGACTITPTPTPRVSWRLSVHEHM